MRASNRRDLYESDQSSGSQHPRKQVLEMMKSAIEKMCLQLNGPDGVAQGILKALGLPFSEAAEDPSSPQAPEIAVGNAG